MCHEGPRSLATKKIPPQMLPTLDHIRYLYKNTSENESMLAFESSLRSWRTAVSEKLGLQNQVECGLQDAKHLRLTEEPKATAKPSNTSWRNARFSDCISENPKRAAAYESTWTHVMLLEVTKGLGAATLVLASRDAWSTTYPQTLDTTSAHLPTPRHSS